MKIPVGCLMRLAGISHENVFFEGAGNVMETMSKVPFKDYLKIAAAVWALLALLAPADFNPLLVWDAYRNLLNSFCEMYPKLSAILWLSALVTGGLLSGMSTDPTRERRPHLQTE